MCTSQNSRARDSACGFPQLLHTFGLVFESSIYEASAKTIEIDIAIIFW